ncbi:MAG: leucyl/phenylalanyl-tRNA--protein transferase [Chromatiales bacterium]|jgi:leucyl/phenylalanyl-tRNA--protein transferase
MLHLLDPADPQAPFPDPSSAEREPNGLLAIGGDLSVPRLLNAYRAGIFPWYSEGQPILWWSPDPRTVLYPERLRISRSLRKTLRKGRFQATVDRAFSRVVESCAAPRPGEPGTWITRGMARAYDRLAAAGAAHSVEIWEGGHMVGGLYGVALGRVFFGESMFSRTSDASKAALVHLVDILLEAGYRLVDCQVYSDHLLSLGAEEIPRAEFERCLDRWVDEPAPEDAWRRPAPVPVAVPDRLEPGLSP